MKKTALILLLLVFLAGCRTNNTLPASENDGDPKVNGQVVTFTIYLMQGEYLIPVTVQKEEQPGFTDFLEGAVNALQEWKASEWAVSPLPPAAEIRKVTREDSTAVIDFGRETAESLAGGTFGEIMLLKSLTLTLTAIEGIERVQILVEGEIKEAAFGHIDTSEPLEPPQFINLEEPAVQGEAAYLKLWFTDRQGMFSILVSRAVPESELNYRTALRELLRGPQPDSPLLSPFPKGTALKNVSLQGETCIVDFSRDFVDNHTGGTAGERHILQALVLTLTEFDEITEVLLLVEGEKGEAILGHLPTYQPLRRQPPNIFE